MIQFYYFSVDGEWSSWSSWSTCEVTCGGGIIIRTRTCDDPEPSNGGEDCVGSAIEVDECNMQECEGKYSHKSFFYLASSLLSFRNLRGPNMWGSPWMASPRVTASMGTLPYPSSHCTHPTTRHQTV